MTGDGGDIEFLGHEVAQEAIVKVRKRLGKRIGNEAKMPKVLAWILPDDEFERVKAEKHEAKLETLVRESEWPERKGFVKKCIAFARIFRSPEAPDEIVEAWVFIRHSVSLRGEEQVEFCLEHELEHIIRNEGFIDWRARTPIHKLKRASVKKKTT